MFTQKESPRKEEGKQQCVLIIREEGIDNLRFILRRIVSFQNDGISTPTYVCIYRFVLQKSGHPSFQEFRVFSQLHSLPSPQLFCFETIMIVNLSCGCMHDVSSFRAQFWVIYAFFLYTTSWAAAAALNRRTSLFTQSLWQGGNSPTDRPPRSDLRVWGGRGKDRKRAFHPHPCFP